MQITVRRLSELSFGQLMEVYHESNREAGRQLAPGAPENVQLLEAEQDFYAYLRDCFFRTEGAFYYIWEESGQYVSALRAEPYQDGLLITGLETRPEKRNQGYAGKLLAALCGDLAGLGVLYSHVKKGNPASLRTHFAAGFSRIKEYGEMLNGSVSAGYCTMKKQL